MSLTKTFRTIFRDYVVDGVSSSGVNKPSKADLRQWGDEAEQVVLSPIAGGFINKFRNGTFDVWSRGTGPISVPVASAPYTADGWIALSGGATSTVDRVTNTRPNSPTQFGLQFTGGAGVTDAVIRQRLESIFSKPLAGQVVTFQMQVFNNTGGAVVPILQVLNPTAADNWGATTTDVASQNLQSCPDGAWTQVSFSWTSSANADKGMQVNIDFGNNFSTTSDKVIVAEADIRAASYVQSPEMRPRTIDELICFRYLPAWASSGPLGQGFCLSGTTAVILLNTLVPTRIATTGMTVSAMADFALLDAGGTLHTCFSLSYNSSTPYTLQFLANVTSSPGVIISGNGTNIYGLNANSRLYATGAEL